MNERISSMCHLITNSARIIMNIANWTLNMHFATYIKYVNLLHDLANIVLFLMDKLLCGFNSIFYNMIFRSIRCIDLENTHKHKNNCTIYWAVFSHLIGSIGNIKSTNGRCVIEAEWESQKPKNNKLCAKLHFDRLAVCDISFAISYCKPQWKSDHVTHFKLSTAKLHALQYLQTRTQWWMPSSKSFPSSV